MMNKNCIFIGDRQIGVNCLRQLLKKEIIPKLVISNMDDNGKDKWYESFVKVAEANGLNVIKRKKVSDHGVIKKIKGVL